MKLTRRGRRLLLLAIAIAAVGRVLAVTELLVIGICVLVLIGVSLAWVANTRMRLRLQRSITPIRVHAGDDAVADLRVTNLGRRTPVFTITDAVTGTNGATLRAGPLRTGMTSQGSYRLPTRRRGRLMIGPAQITVADPLALAEVSLKVGGSTKFTIYPQIVPLTTMPYATGPQALAANGKLHLLHRVGEDFYALRDYTVGDDPRRIHWRSTARLGRPMVREGEIPRQNQLSILLDTRSESYDEPKNTEVAGRSFDGAARSFDGAARSFDSAARSFDSAVTIAASVLAAAIGRGDAVRLVTTGGLATGFATTAHSASEIFNHLTEVELADFESLRPALGRVGGRGAGAVVVVVGPHLQDPTTDIAAITTLAGQAGSLITLRCGASPGQQARGTQAQAAQAQTGVTLVDVADPSQLPEAWQRACARTGTSATTGVTGIRLSSAVPS